MLLNLDPLHTWFQHLPLPHVNIPSATWVLRHHRHLPRLDALASQRTVLLGTAATGHVAGSTSEIRPWHQHPVETRSAQVGHITAQIGEVGSNTRPTVILLYFLNYRVRLLIILVFHHHPRNVFTLIVLVSHVVFPTHQMWVIFVFVSILQRWRGSAVGGLGNRPKITIASYWGYFADVTCVDRTLTWLHFTDLILAHCG